MAQQIEEKMDQLQPGQIRSFLREHLEDDRYYRSVFMARFTTEERSQTKGDYRK